jgi:hypothetical protein
MNYNQLKAGDIYYRECLPYDRIYRIIRRTEKTVFYKQCDINGNYLNGFNEEKAHINNTHCLGVPINDNHRNKVAIQKANDDRVLQAKELCRLITNNSNLKISEARLCDLSIIINKIVYTDNRQENEANEHAI